MTREEAIRLLTTKRAQPSTDYQMAEVYTMAIKALEQEARWIPVSGGLPEEREWMGTKIGNRN